MTLDKRMIKSVNLIRLHKFQDNYIMFSNVNLTDCVVNLISVLASLCAFDVQPSKDVLAQDAN